MRMKNKTSVFLLSLLLMILTGCVPSAKINRQNIAYLYKPGKFPCLQTKVYKESPESIRVYLKPIALDGSAFPIEAEFISFNLLDSYESKFVVDSALFRLLPEHFITADSSILRFRFQPPDTGNYIMEVKLLDQLKRVQAKTFMQIDNASDLGSQNYLLMDSADQPVIDPYINPGKTLRIMFNQKISRDLFVYHYDRIFSLALPPFVTKKLKPFDYKPDSVFKRKIEGGLSTPFRLNKNGFYYFVLDTTKKEGFTTFVFYKGYPGIITADQMLPPLRYITVEEEFEKMKQMGQPKMAVDSFWLAITDNLERASSAIRNFYRRVKLSNLYFSSYQEGWRTDRGMIFMIFGPPRTVNRGNIYEIWVYGEENSPAALEFEFVKIRNPFTENDYRLLRSSRYREKWYFMVNNWRR